MFPSKKADVDKHVEQCLKKINNETERSLRCLTFAKQYFKIEQYDEARRHVSTYLSVKPNSAEAHLLLGKILEMMGRREAAIKAYKTSLKLEPKQNGLVMKVCELLASEDVNMDLSGARYFCAMATALDTQNPAVLSLKQRIIASASDDPQEVADLLRKEMETHPNDVSLKVRLLKHLLQHNMFSEAYKHASEMESLDLPLLHNSLSWYETVAEVLVKYQRSGSQPDTTVDGPIGWEFWFLSVSVFDRLVSLALEENADHVKITNEYVQTVFNFDQTLAKAVQNVSDCPDKYLVQEFLKHYRAQLCLHFTTLAFKQARKDLTKYKDAVNMTLPLLFAAYHSPPPDLQSLWFTHASEKRRSLMRRWGKEGAFRCSQAGHILLSAAKDRKSIIIEKATQYSVGMWRQQLFKKLFVIRDQQLKINTSHFLTDPQLIEITIQLPELVDLDKYDDEAQLLHPDSLHHHIWLGISKASLTNLNCTVFEGMQYTVRHLKNCGAETLNLLDLQAFLYCAILTSKANLNNEKQMSFFNADKPELLPAAVTQELGTANQNIFFKAAYKIYKNQYDSALDQVRLLLIEGIKLLRCVDNGLHVRLLVELANVFGARSKILTKQSDIEANEVRAELYWKSALPLLERMSNGQAVSYPPNKMFNYRTREMSSNEIRSGLEQGKLFMGTQLMKRKEYEKAVSIFEVLKDPNASYNQAQMYKSMAEQITGQNKEHVTSEMRSQNIILLSRARDCLYLTLDRLREPSVDPKHPLNVQLGSEIEKIERLLSRIDPDCENRNECDGMSVSSGDSADHYVTGYGGTNLSYLNGTYQSRGLETRNHSTPYRGDNSRREARPSPERLDAQLRQLTATRDSTTAHILDELKNTKDTVVNELKIMRQGNDEIKKQVDELKAAIDDLDSFKSISDMIYEMKKEIAELKKDVAKPAQLSEEDIYGLANEYSADYGISSANLGAYAGATNNIYTNYQARMAPPAASIYGPPPALYPGMYPPPLAYAYGGLGLPQPPGMPFGSEQEMLMTEHNIRAMSAALSQVQPGVVPPNLLTGQGLAQVSPQQPPQSLFKDLKTIPISSQSALAFPTNKAPPVNVVITTSDPLPSTNVLTTQPILSVTIPPQHLKGVIPKPQPHNYQIPMPSVTLASQPSVLSKPAPVISTQSLLSYISAPVYSAVSDKSSAASINVSLGLQIEKSLDNTFNNSKTDISSNKSNVSSTSVDEHDPCPDFKPIIALPEEVPVNTGEEQETELFCERARLFRYTNKEWKERGIGVLKILFNPATSKVRLLMRRDQVHKICANHFIKPDMTLTAMANSDRAYIWAAHDFADEEVVLEKLCARFKSSEEATKFHNAFEEAKKKSTEAAKPTPTSVATPTPTLKGFSFTSTPTFQNKPISETPIIKAAASPSASLGGFMFSNTPTFQHKPIGDSPIVKPVETTPKSSPFANFSFGNSPAPPKSVEKPTEDEPSEDFVPTAEFKPVVALPELIDVKTGEEDCEVLFEERAKLMRFDTSGTTKEWKERGLGMIKLLRNNTVRLLMRREQVHKVCCNHQVLKNMDFKLMPNNPKALTWCAKDFSEGVLTPETFAIRFKTEELALAFQKAVISAQASLDSSNAVTMPHVDKHMKTEPPKSDFGEKFKPVKGSWSCKNCYIFNDAKLNYCMACETPKIIGSPIKNENNASGAAFSFGVPSTFKTTDCSWQCILCYTRNDSEITVCVSCKTPKEGTATPKAGGLKFSFGASPLPQPATTISWGDKFKPKKDSWECKQCYIRNTSEVLHCISCESPKDDTVPKKEAPKAAPVETPYTFGIPVTAKPSPIALKPTTPQWGELFKPKEGSWACKQCYIRNTSDILHCVSCECPKDDTVPKKDAPVAAPIDTKYTFGIPVAAKPSPIAQKSAAPQWGELFKPKEGSWECKQCYIRNTSDILHCVSCDCPKDDTVPKKDAPTAAPIDSKYSFGIPATSAKPSPIAQKPAAPQWGELFKPKEGSWECKQCYIRNTSDILHCVSCDSPKDDTVPKKEASTGINLETEELKYTFGVPSTGATSATFTFGQSTIPGATQFSFAPKTTIAPSAVTSETTTEEKATASETVDKFVFGSPQRHDFEFTPRSPRKSSGGQKDDDSDTSCLEEECDTIYFKPLIPLPDKVEVKTGEESEEVLYSHRAKLFRFASGEWKERGLGDIKILRRKDNGKLRVLMRREQVLKICLNHALTNDVKYMPKSETTWLFAVADFSEGELSNEQFCVRFKTADIAQEFLKAVNDALKGPSDEKEDSSDDVQFVSETKVTPEEEKEALKLGLPPKFLAYRQLPDCKCTQCENDDKYLSGTSLSTNTKPSAPFSFISGSITPKETIVSKIPISTNSERLKSLLSKPSLLTTPEALTSPNSHFSSTQGSFASVNSSISEYGSPPEEAENLSSHTPTNDSQQKDSIFGGFKIDSSLGIYGSESAVTSTTGITFGGVKTGTFFGPSPTGPQNFKLVKPPTPPALKVVIATPKLIPNLVSTQKSETNTSSLFKNSGSIFGGTNATSSASIFGGASTTTTGPSTFGSSGIFSNAAKTAFGGTANLFGTPKDLTVKSAFGAGDKKAESTTTTNLKESDGVILDSNSGISFAALAAKTSTAAPPAFAGGDDSTKTPFSFLGAGAPVFSSANTSKNKSMGDDEKGEDDNYDPHYEPIIPLPDAIVVSTGEEDETVVFNERAKLFRYDANTKEWKERGVGQMKLLHHAANNTYRFLLRREQVHKVVLNQLITGDLDLQPMKMSDKAWVWAGYNYTDDDSALEKLAIRFKNYEQAQQFQTAVQSTLAKIKDGPSVTPQVVEELVDSDIEKLIPSTIQNYGCYEDVSSDEQDSHRELGYNEYDENDEDDDDRTIMLMKRCLLSEEVDGQWYVVAEGDLQVYYDPEYYAATICVSDDTGMIVSNTLIAVNTKMTLEGNECIWKAVESCDGTTHWRTLKATFSNPTDAEEFHYTYLEGLNYAVEFDVVDDVPSGEHEND